MDYPTYSYREYRQSCPSVSPDPTICADHSLLHAQLRRSRRQRFFRNLKRRLGLSS